MKNLKYKVRGPAFMFLSDFYVNPYGDVLRVTLKKLKSHYILLDAPIPKNNNIGLTDEL